MLYQRKRSLNPLHSMLTFDIEPVERRVMLSGDVTAQLNNLGDLVLRGDSESNEVHVALVDGSIVVSGMDDTTINGETNSSRFDADGLTRNLRIRMLGGDDLVIVGGETHEEPTQALVEGDDDEPKLTVPGNVDINTGSGHDTVRVSFVDIGGKLTVRTGTGEDIVDVGRGPGFAGEDHDDSLLVAAAVNGEDGSGGGPPADVSTGACVLIATGSGADQVKVAFSDIATDMKVTTGSGEDYLVTGRGPIFGDDHEEMLAFQTDEGGQGGRPADLFVGGRMTVQTSGDNDFVLLRNTQISDRLNIATGSGEDRLGVQNTAVMGPTSLSTSAGDDVVSLMDSVFDGDLTVRTLGGDDCLYFGSTRVYGEMSAFTGSGADILVVVDSQLLGGSRLLAQGGDDNGQSMDSVFEGSILVNGGTGEDNVGDSGSSFNTDDATEVNVENHEFEPEVVDAMIDKISDDFAGFLQGTP